MPEKPPRSLDLEQPCNHFELRLEDGVAQGKHLTDGKITLYSEIWVDGHHIDEPHFIDLPLLVQSLHEQRWFEIFTCGCGVGGCAGTIHALNDQEAKLLFSQPRSKYNISCDYIENFLIYGNLAGLARQC